MNRRDFLGIVGAAVCPLSAAAQHLDQVPVGFLSATSAEAYPHLLAAFHRGLAETGYADGRNLAISYRWAEGDYKRLPALAAELVRQKPTVIAVTGGSVSAIAAKAATSTIPLVVLSGGDPIKLGLIESFSRPGGNVTGVAQLTNSLGAKRFELLRELVPQASVIALLVNPDRPTAEMQAEVDSAAHALGLATHVVRARRESELEAAFAELRASRAGALMVVPDPFFLVARKAIVASAARYGLPAIYDWREFAEDGGLVSYGTSLAEAYRQVGVYTGRVLSGAKPADLPMVQQSTKLELVFNARTARALGISISPSLLARADEVIE
jgi:putative ABC transport system substrate-binding protein